MAEVRRGAAAARTPVYCAIPKEATISGTLSSLTRSVASPI